MGNIYRDHQGAAGTRTRDEWAREALAILCGEPVPGDVSNDDLQDWVTDRVPSWMTGYGDIAGLVSQLSASSWLRGKRGASWASACIDEPFASLDKVNSRSLGVHLNALIRGDNDFDQGFLVGHDAAAMESLPARIMIHGSADGAVAEVV